MELHGEEKHGETMETQRSCVVSGCRVNSVGLSGGWKHGGRRNGAIEGFRGAARWIGGLADGDLVGLCVVVGSLGGSLILR